MSDNGSDRTVRRVSFEDEEPKQESAKRDSTQDDQRSPPARATRRPSLTEAVRRASTLIGDGLCESKKELKMLGVLPDCDSDEDDLYVAPADRPVLRVDPKLCMTPIEGVSPKGTVRGSMHLYH